MKSKLAVFVAMLLICPIFGAVSAHAQLNDTVKADVPFDFYAGTKTMPAAQYFLRLDVGSRTVEINDDAGHSALLMGIAVSEDSGAQPKLVFDKVGDTYFLEASDSADLDVQFPVKKQEDNVTAIAESTQVTVATNGM